jgi:psp operon transcriptional activator
VQEKILRVIEYGGFERVGSNETHHVDVRIVAATNVDLPALAETGRFRHDLIDRLAFDVVTIPPWRERTEDIPLLAEHFGRGMTRELGREAFHGFTSGALDRLVDHRWPGNVREFKNVVERSLYRWSYPNAPTDDIVFDAFASPHRPSQPVALPPPLLAIEHAAPSDFLGRLAAYEQKLLGDALAANHFNQRRTAAALGLTYDQLRHHLKKRGLGARGAERPVYAIRINHRSVSGRASELENAVTAGLLL